MDQRLIRTTCFEASVQLQNIVSALHAAGLPLSAKKVQSGIEQLGWEAAELLSKSTPNTHGGDDD